LRERLSQTQENEQDLTIEPKKARKNSKTSGTELDIVRAQLEEVELKLAPANLPAEEGEEASALPTSPGSTITQTTSTS